MKFGISAGPVAALLLLAPAAHAAEAHRPTRVTFTVVCADASVQAKFETDIRQALAANPGYELSDKAPAAELILYVNRDAEDGVNPNGYSIAIAHVSNAQAYFLAYKLLVQKPTGDDDIKTALLAMLRQRGNLDHLNVAHIDRASDREIAQVSRSVVSAFVAKVPANLGR